MITKSHAQVVIDLLKVHFADKQITGVEIGTGDSTVTRNILWACKNVFLYTIDPWMHEDENLYEAGREQALLDTTKQLAYTCLAAPDISDRVTIIAKKSIDALTNVPNVVDFVWIDGSHMEKDFIKDIELYQPLVREGGIIGGHDFGLVHEVTNYCFKRYHNSLNSGNDFTWWVYV